MLHKILQIKTDVKLNMKSNRPNEQNTKLFLLLKVSHLSVSFFLKQNTLTNTFLTGVKLKSVTNSV
jgi:hypothetical protein